MPGEQGGEDMEGKCCRKPYAHPPAPGGGCMTLCVALPVGATMDCNTELREWSTLVQGACLPGAGACSAGGKQPVTLFQYRCLGPVACTVQSTRQVGKRCKWFETGHTQRVEAPTCTGVLCPS